MGEGCHLLKDSQVQGAPSVHLAEASLCPLNSSTVKLEPPRLLLGLGMYPLPLWPEEPLLWVLVLSLPLPRVA